MANEALKKENISSGYVLAMRFISISSLLFQGKRDEAIKDLNDFIVYYRLLPGDYDRDWSYTITKEFINGNKLLPPKQTRLLLDVIDLLEGSKNEGDKKIKAIEDAIKML
jgi:hypothetical protein